MIARVPASSANLGPGFDTLALALAMYVEVEAEPANSFGVTSYGEGSNLEVSDGYLGARVVERVLGHSKVHLCVRSQIPLGRGLGSSAAFAAACAAAVGAEDPFSIASWFDGHPENAAASVFGGFVTAAEVASEYVSNRLPVDPELAAVVVIPNIELATKTARGVLPTDVPFEDAVFNMGRMGLLIAGFADLDRLLPEATQDRLHQDFRTLLFPNSARILEVLRESGAVASCWSGAGPTMIGFCKATEAVGVMKNVEHRLKSDDMRYSVRAINVDLSGLIIADSYGPGFQPLEVASL